MNNLNLVGILFLFVVGCGGSDKKSESNVQSTNVQYFDKDQQFEEGVTAFVKSGYNLRTENCLATGQHTSSETLVNGQWGSYLRVDTSLEIDCSDQIGTLIYLIDKKLYVSKKSVVLGLHSRGEISTVASTEPHNIVKINEEESLVSLGLEYVTLSEITVTKQSGTDCVLSENVILKSLGDGSYSIENSGGKQLFNYWNKLEQGYCQAGDLVNGIDLSDLRVLGKF